MVDAAASPSLPPRTQHLPASPASQLLAALPHIAVPIKTRRSPRPRPDAMARSPSTTTTSAPKSSAADLEEHKGTGELWRAIKIEKATGQGHEEHKGAGELHMEPPKCKKKKRSRQSSGELHEEHQETNKVVMKSSTSKKKRKASEEMCTNPPAPLLGPLAVDMDMQAPPGSLPVDKDKQPSPGHIFL